MSARRRFRRIFSILVLAGSLSIGPARAGDYEVTLGVKQHFEYDDNIDFTPIKEAETEASQYVLTPQVGFDARSERWTFGADLELPFQRFSVSRLDTDNQRLDLSGERRLPQGVVNLAGFVLRNSTRRTEEETSGFFDEAARRRVQNALTGAWTRVVGEKSQISLSGAAQTVNYASDSDFLDDYLYESLQVGWTRVLTTRLSSQLNVFTTRLESEEKPQVFFGFLVPIPDSRSDTYAVQGGFTRVFSERLRGDFLVGVRRVEATSFQAGFVPPFIGVVPFTSESTGGLANVAIAYTGERFELATAVSRTLNPSSDGRLLESDRLTVQTSFRMRERLYVRVNATVSRNDSVALVNEGGQQVVFAFNRNYYELTPRVEWLFRRNWSLVGGLSLHNRDPVEAPDPAKSHSVFIDLNYRSQPFFVFR